MSSRGSAVRARMLVISIGLVLLSTMAFVTVASAAASLTTPANATISADTGPAPGSDSGTVVGGPVITENLPGDITPGGDVVLTIASGAYAFTAATVGATAQAGSCGITASPAVVGATTVTTTLGGTATTSSDRCRVTFSVSVKPTTGTVPNVGTITIGYTGAAAVAGLASGATVGTLTEVAGAAFTITIATQPTSSTGGVALPVQPKVHVVDRFANPVPSAPVSLAITPATGSPLATLFCTAITVATTGGGDAQFAGCKIDVAATGYKLRASSGSAAPADSAAFNITVGPKDHLSFFNYPAASTQTLFSPQPIVRVVDAGGNVVVSATDTVTLTINQNTAFFTCAAGTSRVALSGVATFTGCTETVVANGYFLTAKASGLPDAGGATFNVTSGVASKLALCWGPALPCNTTPPATTVSTTPFALQPMVIVQDAAGNTVVTDSTTVVTLSIFTGTPTSGGPGSLTCTSTSVTVVLGIATFTGCRIDKVGTGYRLNAASLPILTAAQSGAFAVIVGPAIKIGFLVQPGSVSAGAPITPAVSVAIQDAGGNTVTSGVTATIALTIGANPVGGVLNCGATNAATTSAGVATFPNCTINAQGVGYTLVATPTAVAPSIALGLAQTSPFTVLAPLAAITVTPSSSVIKWGKDVTLNVHFGTNGAYKTFALQVTKDGVNWNTIGGAAALMTDAIGNASFVYGPSDNRYYRAVFAGTPDLQPGMSATVRVVVRQLNILRPPTTSSPRVISPGTQITFVSTTRPNRPELPQAHVEFRVFQLQGRTWTQVLTQTLGVNSAGIASLKVTFVTKGKFYVRSQAVPTPLNANSGWSPVIRYDVR